MKKDKLPPWLSIKPSGIPGAGLGVFAELDIKKGLRLGEYTGRHLSPQEYARAENSVYVWELRKKNVPVLYVDGKHPRLSNWTRYVNCARTRQEENVQALQVELKMFYYAKRHIPAGEELLVWYGVDYGKWLLGKRRL